MGTTLLRGGRIVDGTGKVSFNGHLLIDGDVIRAVLKDGEELPISDRVIDAKGRVISPGFIDMHSHADWLLPLDDHPKLLKRLIEQGATTFIGGNCGFSPAPIQKETLRILDAGLAATIIDRPFDYTWKGMGEFLDHVEASGPVMNVAQLVGHATIRVASAVVRRGAMNPDELQNGLDMVRCSFDEGACGLSFGLGYDPGMYSPVHELEAFSRVASEAGRPVTVHLKALSRISPCYPVTYLRPHNLRALKEMIEIARNTGVRLQMSHFIFVGRKTWPTADACIRQVEYARGQGIDVMIDAFPFTCGNTTINVILPYWFLAKLPQAYKSNGARARLRVELASGFFLVGFFFKDFQVMDAAVEGWEGLNGLRLDEVARRWKTTPFDAMLKLSCESRGAALMLFHTYSGEPGNEGPLKNVLSHDLCLFETDALIKSRGFPNPAAMGTFPKILGHYVRERRLFSIEDAVKRMTSASAQRFGFRDRGELAPGKAADVVVFDPDTISDVTPADGQPAAKPKGIEHVFINGTHVVRNGSYIEGSRAGRVLRA
jgi:N-acyl-D-amino-acid deacylase